MSTIQQPVKDSYSTIKAFYTNFVSPDLFSNIVNVCLYPSEFTSTTVVAHNNSVIEYLKTFLTDLGKTAKTLNLANLNQIYSSIGLCKTILNIRDSGSSIVTYGNVFQHLPNLDLSQQKIIQEAINNKIETDAEFRKNTDNIINTLQAYYEVCSISDGLIEFESFSDYASSSSVSVFEATKEYKDKVVKLYNDLSNLQMLNKQESEKDYYVVSDRESTKELSESLVHYLKNHYSFFKTGYNIFDNNIDGFESGSVHLISSGTNHGKSLLKTNLAKTIIENNLDDFNENDAVLFVTLEDDIRKLTRRICSIFGNYKQTLIKQLYSSGYTSLKAQTLESDVSDVETKLTETMNKVVANSIYEVTAGKVKLVIKHCSEDSFSTGDLSKFIDLLQVENVNVKVAIIDYVDVMTPTVNNYQMGDSYETQGQIVQELRNLSRHHKLPVISSTQNKREAENMQYGMSNTMVGDSYKKIRYSDFIYMARQNTSFNVFDDAVKYHVFSKDDYQATDQLSNDILNAKDDICENLIPFEIKITKSKEEGKDANKFALLCKQNLRIYNTVREYLQDVPQMEKLSRELTSDITMLSNMSTVSPLEDMEQVGDVPEEDETAFDAPFPFLEGA